MSTMPIYEEISSGVWARALGVPPTSILEKVFLDNDVLGYVNAAVEGKTLTLTLNKATFTAAEFNEYLRMCSVPDQSLLKEAITAIERGAETITLECPVTTRLATNDEVAMVTVVVPDGYTCNWAVTNELARSEVRGDQTTTNDQAIRIAGDSDFVVVDVSDMRTSDGVLIPMRPEFSGWFAEEQTQFPINPGQPLTITIPDPKLKPIEIELPGTYTHEVYISVLPGAVNLRNGQYNPGIIVPPNTPASTYKLLPADWCGPHDLFTVVVSIQGDNGDGEMQWFNNVPLGEK